MGLFLAETSFADLSMGKNTDNGTVFSDTLHLTSNGFAAVFCMLFGVTSEGLLLGSIPVFVEATFDFV